METMKDANQFANIEEAAEPVEVAPENMLPAVRIADLEAQLNKLNDRLVTQADASHSARAELEARLRDAEARADDAEKKHGDAARESFQRGKRIAELERDAEKVKRELESVTRVKDAAEVRANAHIVESDGLKAQLLAQIADNEALRRRNDSLEARLAEGAPCVEFDIIQDAAKDDLRAAEMAGWSIKHMQFSETGTLRVVLHRAKPQQPHDRKPATATHAIPTRTIVPPVPARPAPSTSADHIDDAGYMVIIGLDGMQGEAGARVLMV